MQHVVWRLQLQLVHGLAAAAAHRKRARHAAHEPRYKPVVVDAAVAVHLTPTDALLARLGGHPWTLALRVAGQLEGVLLPYVVPD